LFVGCPPSRATLGPYPGHERPDRGGQHRTPAVRHFPSTSRTRGQDRTSPRPPRFSLARRKSSGPRSALGRCRNGHAWASAVTNGHMDSSSRSPAFRLKHCDAASSKSACGPEIVDREVPRGPLLRTVGRRTPTYFCGIPLQTGPSHPRRTRQRDCISHPNQTKKPPGHPSLRGAADSSRLPPF
jgi:hypothetical protein